MTKVKFISWAIVIAWMGLVLFLSSQPASESAALSRGVTHGIVAIIQWIVPGIEINVGSVHALVRKSAHFGVYLVLGFLVMNALKQSGAKWRSRTLLALLICVIYAIVDETYQVFVPGRAGQVTDVIIDSVGALTGILAHLGLSRLKLRRAPRTESSQQ